MSTPDGSIPPLRCQDCGLILTPQQAHALTMPNGVTVFPLCDGHFEARIDTIEGTP